MKARKTEPNRQAKDRTKDAQHKQVTKPMFLDKDVSATEAEDFSLPADVLRAAREFQELMRRNGLEVDLKFCLMVYHYRKEQARKRGDVLSYCWDILHWERYGYPSCTHPDDE